MAAGDTSAGTAASAAIVGRVRLSAPIAAGVPFEVRVLLRHPMETGFRHDELGRPVPRNVIRELVCRRADRELLRASLGSGISANPYLRFFLQVDADCELGFEWVDDAGARGAERVAVKLGAAG
jgi:sulfur-oxidizing protein SoxZ